MRNEMVIMYNAIAIMTFELWFEFSIFFSVICKLNSQRRVTSKSLPPVCSSTTFPCRKNLKRFFGRCQAHARWITAVLITTSLVGIYFLNFRSFGLLSDMLSSERHPSVWKFQENVEKEFPIKDTDVQRIPHIIHQYYSSEYVPAKYVPYMRSFVQMNPSWEYRFWTFISARKLIEKELPFLLEKYDCLGNTVQNTNILRLAALYHYGGVYTDLDVEDLRPLDKVTLKYSCIFPPEPFEHAILGYRMEFAVQTATLMCRQFHPFLKFILDKMQDVSCTAPTQFNTGVAFVTNLFMIYHNITGDIKHRQYSYESNSPFFYRGTLKEDDVNAVYVPNTQYFSDNLAPKMLSRLPLVCSFFYIQSNNNKRACNEFNKRKQLRLNRTYTFLSHEWFNSYNMYKKRYYKSMKTVHILDIIPQSVL